MNPLSSQPTNPIDAVPSCDHLEIGRKHLQLLARTLVFAAGRLLGQEVWKKQSQQMQDMDEVEGMLTLVDIWQDTTLRDGNVAEQLVQLLVVADGELKVTGDDTGLLVVASSVASQFEDLSSQVLEDGCEVDGST